MESKKSDEQAFGCRVAGYATRQRVGGGVVRDPDRQIIPLL